VRGLRADIVNAQRGQQADDAVRDGRDYHGDGLKLVRVDRCEPIESGADLLDRTFRNEPLEFGERNPKGRDITRPKESAKAGFPKTRRGERWGGHVQGH
jgi:hypothetical protein